MPGSRIRMSRVPARKAQTAARAAEAASMRKRCLETPGADHWDAWLTAASGFMWAIAVQIGSRSFTPVRPHRLTFWCGQESHGGCRSTTRRSPMSFREPEP